LDSLLFCNQQGGALINPIDAEVIQSLSMNQKTLCNKLKNIPYKLFNTQTLVDQLRYSLYRTSGVWSDLGKFWYDGMSAASTYSRLTGFTGHIVTTPCGKNISQKQ